jgi:hypothetical protein
MQCDSFRIGHLKMAIYGRNMLWVINRQSCIVDGMYIKCNRMFKYENCFRPFWIGKLWEKCLPIWTLLYVSFKNILSGLTTWPGRAISEAVTSWFPTAAVRVRARVWQVGLVVDKVASGQVFSEYFGFHCQNHSFHQILRHYHNHPGQLTESLQWGDHPSEEYCWLS